MADLDALLIARAIHGARNPNHSAMIGDSRAALFHASGSSGFKSAQHPLTWAMALMGQRLRSVYNGGISGYRSDQWQLATSPAGGVYTGINNVTAMLSTDALWALFPGIAANDISADRTADEIWTGYGGAPGMKATLDAVRAAGMRAVVFGETGVTGWAAARIGQMHKLNRLLRAYCEANPGAIWLDQGAAVWLPTSTAAIAFRSGFVTDGTHLGSLGAHAVGQALATTLSPMIPAFDERISAGHETKANGGVQVCPNPLFLSTGGGVGSGITGSAPLNVYIDRSGTPTATASIIDDPGGYGKAIQIDGTFTASGQELRCGIALGTSGWAAGEKYFGQARVSVAAGSANVCAPYLFLEFIGNGYTVAASSIDCSAATAFGPGPATAYALDLKTPVTTIPTFSTVDNFGLHVRMLSTGAGSQSVVIARASVTKVG